MTLKDSELIGTVILGKALATIGPPRTAELYMGRATWQEAPLRFEIKRPDGSTEDFDGHRTLIDVRLHSENYLKESELSGDEYRKGGEGCIFADGVQVYEFFFRDVQWALRRADYLISQLSEHSSSWLHKEYRDKLVGKKVFYDRTPAVITSLITDQGCIILKPDGVPEFPPPVWADGGDYGRDDNTHIKDEILSPHIWWHRKV